MAAAPRSRSLATLAIGWQPKTKLTDIYAGLKSGGLQECDSINYFYLVFLKLDFLKVLVLMVFGQNVLQYIVLKYRQNVLKYSVLSTEFQMYLSTQYFVLMYWYLVLISTLYLSTAHLCLYITLPKIYIFGNQTLIALIYLVFPS